MKREIEFRGKREDNGEWIYGDLYQEKKPYTKTNEIKEVMIVEYRPDLCLVSGAPDNNHLWRDVIPETVGQFTGLRDKNGVKIYEGDILKIKETPFQIGGLHQVIFYEDRYLTYSILYNDVDQANKHPLLYQIEYADAHVIGNIYDNPELLNK